MTTSQTENKLKSSCVCSCLIPFPSHPCFFLIMHIMHNYAINLEYGNINYLCQWLDLQVAFNDIIFAWASELTRRKAQVTKAANEKTASEIGMEKCV